MSDYEGVGVGVGIEGISYGVFTTLFFFCFVIQQIFCGCDYEGVGVGVGIEGISCGFFTILQVIDSARLGLIQKSFYDVLYIPLST